MHVHVLGQCGHNGQNLRRIRTPARLNEHGEEAKYACVVLGEKRAGEGLAQIAEPDVNRLGITFIAIEQHEFAKQRQRTPPQKL